MHGFHKFSLSFSLSACDTFFPGQNRYAITAAKKNIMYYVEDTAAAFNFLERKALCELKSASQLKSK